ESDEAKTRSRLRAQCHFDADHARPRPESLEQRAERSVSSSHVEYVAWPGERQQPSDVFDEPQPIEGVKGAFPEEGAKLAVCREPRRPDRQSSSLPWRSGVRADHAMAP